MESSRASERPTLSSSHHASFSQAQSPLNPNRRSPAASDDSAGSSLRESLSLHAGRDKTSLEPASYGVLIGAVGGAYGPFPRSSSYSGALPTKRDALYSSDVAIDLSAPVLATLGYTPRSVPGTPEEEGYGAPGVLRSSGMSRREGTDQSLLWAKENIEVDDYLHDPDPDLERRKSTPGPCLQRTPLTEFRNSGPTDLNRYGAWSFANVLNTASLIIIVTILVGIFGGWPIYRHALMGTWGGSGTSKNVGWGLVGINSTGQVPLIQGSPSLIDRDTPADVYQRTGFDGETYNLVFSDEFNVDGRTFWPGDDPFWEAVDLWYWATTDLEWYDPDAVTTKDGSLHIILTEESIHDLTFRSGMLQSWNKFCFTGGYMEVSVSLPGSSYVQGYWPGVWTMGNLGRAGYGATNDGVWPYSYDTCDVGTMPNQTHADGLGPNAAKHSESRDYGGELSWSVGQRASACTCPGEDHPGPSVNVGRGAPEIDLIEAQIDSSGTMGSASQSIQIAPFDAGYEWKNTTPYIRVWYNARTKQNQWHGSIHQESLSLMTQTDATSYEGRGWSSFGVEYDPGPDGRITWAINGTQTWELTGAAMGPDPRTEIGQRLVSMEPMAINFNLAISTKFQEPQWARFTFPGTFRIDYVRVWQKGEPNLGCDPKSHPTSDYINRHPEAYQDANLTVWSDTPYPMPKNSLRAGGC